MLDHERGRRAESDQSAIAAGDNRTYLISLALLLPAGTDGRRANVARSIGDGPWNARRGHCAAALATRGSQRARIGRHG